MTRSTARYALLTLGLTAAVGPAVGAPMGPGVEPVHVLALDADDQRLDAVAKTVTNALRQRVLDGEEFTIGGQSPQLVAVAHEAKCDIKRLGRPTVEENERVFDEGCLKRIAARIGAKRFFWGFVHPAGGRPSVRLHFWQEGRDLVAALPYDEASRERVVARLYRKLVTPGLVGDLALAGNASGELVVDGKLQGAYAPGVELTLFAGEHELEVRQGPRVVARARARVEVGGRVEARFEPVAAPSPTPPTLPRGFTDPPGVIVRPRPSAWPWVLGGTAAAGFVGAGAFYLLRRGELGDLGDGCYGRACPPRQQAAVDRADRYGTFAAISLGVGLAAGAGLATHTLTAKRQPRVVGGVVPVAGGAAFCVGGSF